MQRGCLDPDPALPRQTSFSFVRVFPLAPSSSSSSGEFTVQYIRSIPCQLFHSDDPAMNPLLQFLKRKRSPIRDDSSSDEEGYHELAVVDEQVYFYTHDELDEIDEVDEVVTPEPTITSTTETSPMERRAISASPPARSSGDEYTTRAIAQPLEDRLVDGSVTVGSSSPLDSNDENVTPALSEPSRPAAGPSAFGNVSASPRGVPFPSLTAEEIWANWQRRAQSWQIPAETGDSSGSLRESLGLSGSLNPADLPQTSRVSTPSSSSPVTDALVSTADQPCPSAGPIFLFRPRAGPLNPLSVVAPSSNIRARPQPSPYFSPQGPPASGAAAATSLWYSSPDPPRPSLSNLQAAPSDGPASSTSRQIATLPSRAGRGQQQLAQVMQPSPDTALSSGLSPQLQSYSFDRPVRPLPLRLDATRQGESSAAPVHHQREGRQGPEDHQEDARSDRLQIPSFWQAAQPLRDVPRVHVTLLEIACGDYSPSCYRPLAIISGAPFPLLPNRGDQYTLDISPEIQGMEAVRSSRVTALLSNLGDDLSLGADDIRVAGQWMSNALAAHLGRAIPTAMSKWVAIPLRRGISLEDVKERVDRDSFGWREMKYPTGDWEFWDHDKILLHRREPSVCYVARPDTLSFSSRGGVVYEAIPRRRADLLVLPGDLGWTFSEEDRPRLEAFFLSASTYRAASALPTVMYNLNETLMAHEASQRLFGGFIQTDIMRRAITTRTASPGRPDMTYEVLEFAGDRLINFAGAFEGLCEARRYPAEVTGTIARVVITNRYLGARGREHGISGYLRTATLSDAVAEETGRLFHTCMPRSAEIRDLDDKVSTDGSIAGPECAVGVQKLTIMQIFAARL